MAIKSISDFYSFSLFIFDLDNTIYKEEDYLFQAYLAIAEKFSASISSVGKEQLFGEMKDLYEKQGREKLFDKFLATFNLPAGNLIQCLEILRSFKPTQPIEIEKNAKHILLSLKERKKKIFVLTNGNPDQQKNKIRNLNWEGLDKYINFVYANEIEPKPSSAGVFYILKNSGIGKNKAVFIGDSETDKVCASNSGINFLTANNLSELLLNRN